MNKDNAKDFLPIVQALAEGKTIQISDEDGNWCDYTEVELIYNPNDYRIKPEPRVIYFNDYGGTLGQVGHDSVETARLSRLKGSKDGRAVKFIEVIE